MNRILCRLRGHHWRTLWCVGTIHHDICDTCRTEREIDTLWGDALTPGTRSTTERLIEELRRGE